MQKDWYEVRVSYYNEDGLLKKEPYLVQATSFAEAEDRAVECYNASLRKGNIKSVDVCAKRQFSGVLVGESHATIWFKIKAKIILNSDTNNPKLASRTYLVLSDSMNNAISYITDSIKDVVYVEMAQQTPIVEVTYLAL